MLDLKIAICDPDQGYAKSLSYFLLSLSHHHFSVSLFTDENHLSEFLQNNSLDILLIAENLYNHSSIQKNVEVTILLVEGLIYAPLLNIPYIKKYQKAECIIQQMIQCYTTLSPKEITNALNKNNTQCIGIYSPVGGSGKTTVALGLAQVLAKHGHSTLFISIETLPSYSQLLSGQDKNGLSELFYFVSKRVDNLLMKLEGIQSIDGPTGLHYIPAARHIEDIPSFSDEDWNFLLDKLMLSKAYKYLIIDFTSETSGINQNMLEKCSKLILLMGNDLISRWKLDDLLKSTFIENPIKVLKVLNHTRPTKEIWIKEALMEELCCELPYSEGLYVKDEIGYRLNLESVFGKGLRYLEEEIQKNGGSGA